MNPPPYFPGRDSADVISIHSNAPSYTSTLPPNYDVEAGTSSHARPRQQQQQQYSSLLSNGPLQENCLASWASLTGSGHQSRTYANVAERRAQRNEATREMDEAARMVLRRIQGHRPERTEDVTVQQQRMDHSLAEEAKSWDHLLAQMSDWKERERSWSEFRMRYKLGGKKGIGAKIYGRLS